jgi:hypothetical protein
MKQSLKISILSFLFSGVALTSSFSQNDSKLFNDRRVINSHSVEVLNKSFLDIRIGHRFGDVNGQWNTLYGLEVANDVFIGGEYGVTDKFMVGLSRSKGSGKLKMLVNGLAKWNIFHERNNNPFSLTLVGVATATTMAKNERPNTLTTFPSFVNRMSYCGQVVIGKQLTDKFALQANVSTLHRNIVENPDKNTMFSTGFAARLKLNKTIALISDLNIPLSGPQSPFADGNQGVDKEYHMPLGFGIEFDTGGHVFQLNLTNAKGIPQTDFLATTKSSWLDGEFRLGFTISRIFKVR